MVPHLTFTASLILSSLFVPSKSYHTPPPAISPATGLPNQVYTWRNQKIRYQVAGDTESPHTAVLVHGLFVNSDHWRKTLLGLAKAGYRAYALDLLGCGYSSKPHRDSPEARALCGENKRFGMRNNGESSTDPVLAHMMKGADGVRSSIVESVLLGTARGGTRMADIDLRHSLESCYNFYTWADQIVDFTKRIVLPETKNTESPTTTLVANSIGTISSFQATIDQPDLFDGVFVVNPNFRELHVSELPAPRFTKPVINAIQRLLREKGHPLFDALAKPDTVRQILKEPYRITDAIDNELVQVLLDPLLTQGAADVVFDTLSYSSGPLPEQQLQDPRFQKPVWVCYGTDDPWTPPQRVEGLKNLADRVVERIVPLKGVGHCPHDEAPELVNPLLVEFLERVKADNQRIRDVANSVGDNSVRL